MEWERKELHSDPLLMPKLQFEKKPAPYKHCPFRSSKTMKETCWNCAFKEQSTLPYSLEEGLLNLQIYQSLHKKKNLFFFVVSFFFCSHVSM